MNATQHGYASDQKRIIARLNRIEGQVRGIRQMTENGEYCIDILTQISAADSALKSVALLLLDDHLHHCVAKAAADEHSPSSLRSKISRNGTPASASMTAGLYPPLTSTTASCTPSRNGARYALRGAKKNHSTPAVTSSAIISAIAMCIFQPPSVRNWLSISANTITIYPYRVYWQEGRANFSRR